MELCPGDPRQPGQAAARRGRDVRSRAEARPAAGVAQPAQPYRRAALRNPTRVTRRVFLVAGSAGSGKSTLAKALAHELDAGWLQLDSIWLAMRVAADGGTPAGDVLDIDRRMRREDEADDDVLAAHVAASGEVCRALPTVLELELEAHERLVVDGAWLLPSFVTELELPDTEVRSVYVVQRTEADVEAALMPRRGVVPLEDRHRLMNRRIFQYGVWLADQAHAHGLPVVEALPFESLLDRALAALVSH
jgi:2-phosphoglycerate kinase